jgi:hypothetical protein
MGGGGGRKKKKRQVRISAGIVNRKCNSKTEIFQKEGNTTIEAH